MKYLLTIALICFAPVMSQELDTLYNECYNQPRSLYEKKLVEHVRTSLERAINLDSKLNESSFSSIVHSMHEAPFEQESQRPHYHLLNNLCSISGVSYLHVGVSRGGPFIAAIYENQSLLSSYIGIDSFKDYPENSFYYNCNQFLNPHDYQVINEKCFCIDTSVFPSPIDVYFYSGEHSLIAHEKAFTYYSEVFAEVFVVVIDDWGCPWIRKPTFKAFDSLGYHILYEAIIPGREKHDGQYIAVIRR